MPSNNDQSAGVSLLETGLIIDELSKVFAATDDDSRVNNVSKLWKDVHGLTVRQQESLKEVIRDLSRKCEGLETTVDEVNGNRNLEKEMSDLDAYKENIDSEIENGFQAAELLKEQIDALNEEIVSMKNRRTEISDELEKVKVPKVKHQLSLYSNITNIRWNYNSESDDVIKGTAYVPHREDIRTFDLTMKEHSPFFIANHLWDLMD